MAVIRRANPTFPRQWNPRLVPNFPIEIDPAMAPPGLSLSIVPGSHRRFVDFVNGAQPVITGSPGIATSLAGNGFVTNTTGVLGYAQPLQPPTVFSMEALILAGPSIAPSETICAFTQSSDGSSGTYDRALVGNSQNQYAGYSYIGSQSFVNTTATSTSGAYNNNVLSHLVYTNDGTTSNIYLNGVYQASNTGGAYTGYSGAVYFCIGYSQYSPSTHWSGNICLVNFATVPWSAGQIVERAAAPFAMFRSVVRRQYYFTTTTTTSPGAIIIWMD